MLHAGFIDRKCQAGSQTSMMPPRRKQFSAPGALGLGRNDWTRSNLQTTYGNQALLRMINGNHQSPANLSFVDQSAHRKLQRKQDCACGGHCASCSGKSPKPLGFNGELEDVFQQLPPSPGQPAPVTPDAGAGGSGAPAPSPAAPPARSPCSVLCDQAYADPRFNGGGGGLVCMNGLVCACVFDNLPIRRGMCPGFDQIVLNHENRHLGEAEPCPANSPMRRLGPAPGVDLTTVECIHRRQSIAEIDAILPGSAGICRTGMQSIRASLAAFVAAHCGGGP